MKRLSTILLSLLLLLGLSGCRKALDVPAGLHLSERTVSWDAVDGATGYVLKVDDVEYDVEDTSTTLPEDLFGPVALAVKAKDDQSETEWSDTVNAIAVIRLAAPADLAQDGGSVRWDAVPHATGYVVLIDGVEYPTLETAYEIPAGTAADVQVLAVGRSDGWIVSSPYSEILRIRTTLPVPGNIRLSGGAIVWDEVEDAVSYVIMVGDDEYAATTASIDLRYGYAGSHTVRVMAVADGEAFADSGFGSAILIFPTLTLATPGNAAYSAGTLTFDPVEGADGYDILVNGQPYASVSETSWTVPASLVASSGAYLEVVATSLVHLPSPASLRVYLSSTVVWTEMQLRAVHGGAVTLAADIILSQPWEPLDFTGVFDGGGHTVSGIEIDADGARLGFFGILDGAVVRDLTLSGTIVVDSGTMDVSAGGLAGSAIRSDIENVRVLFAIDVTSRNGTGAAGGVFGTVRDCQVDGVVFQGTVSTAWMTTGGFAGRFEASDADASVTRSTVLGSIAGAGGEATPTGGFAGMIMDNRLEIRECSVWGSISGFGYVGGFVGYLGYGAIYDSYVDGTVEAGPMERASLVVAGGFAGRVEGYNVRVVRCLSIATVTWNNASPEVRVGGFAGTTPGGTYANLFERCGYSDAALDRIGNPTVGRGDGIAPLDAALLAAIAAAAPDVWDFDGALIRLAWEE
ncbi:MAG: GLUG motif-containing protein [Candidatus Izemoplasmatales bacterium]